MPQRAPPAADSPFPTQGAAVLCDGCQPRKSRRLFAVDLTEFGHLGDQHRAGDGADAWYRAQNGSGFGNGRIVRNERLNPSLQLCDLAVQQCFEVDIHVPKLSAIPSFSWALI